MASAPKFNPGQIIYLQESAALGFLEALIIQHVGMDQSGRWLYTLATYTKAPTAAQTIGDRIIAIPKRRLPISFYEEDLLLYCDALALCIANLQAQLANLQALQAGCQGSV